MGRVRIQRRNISLDMTAMCDMAFLLLSFFMLATKFKAQEAAAVNMPSSVSENKLAESNIITISVEKSGIVYFGIDGEAARRSLIHRISSKYRIAFTEEEIHAFSLLPSIATPVSGLKQVLAADEDDRKELEKGIPRDSSNNELREWIALAKSINPKAEIAIKGDMDVSFPVIEDLIATIQDLGINKFKLVTSLEKSKR